VLTRMTKWVSKSQHSDLDLNGSEDSGLQSLKCQSKIKRLLRSSASTILFIVICLAILFITYNQGLIVISDDSFFPLNFEYAVYHYSYAWFYGPVNSMNLVPIFILLWAEYSLVNSLVVVQMSLQLVLWVFSGIGMIALCRYITHSRNTVGEIVLASFYTFNLYSLSVIWGALQVRCVFYALLPITILLFSKGLTEIQLHKKVLYLLATTLILSLTGVYYIPLVLIIFLGVSLVFLRRAFLKSQVITWGLFFILLGVTNAYYLLGTLYSLNHTLAAHVAAEPSTLFFAYPQAQNILNSLRLLGFSFIWYWGWGVPNFTWSVFVTSHPLLIFSSLVPITYSIYVLLTPTKHALGLRISAPIILIMGIIVSSAGSPPFGPILYQFLALINLAAIYQIPFQIFGALIVVAYSLFIICGLHNFNIGNETLHKENFSTQANVERETPRRTLFVNNLNTLKIFLIRGKNDFKKSKTHRRYIKRVVSICMFALLAISVILNSYIAWSGQIYSRGISRGPNDMAIPSAFVEVPDDYYALGLFANKLDHNYSLLVLPPYSPASHTWKPANETASDPIIQYFSGGLNIINMDTLTTSPVVDVINNMIFSDTGGQVFLTMLGHLSVRYILIEKDWMDLIYYQQPLAFYMNYINDISSSQNSGLTTIWNSTNLVLYEITNPTPFKIIQLARYSYLISGDMSSMTEFYSFERNQEFPAILDNSQSFINTSLLLSSYPLSNDRTALLLDQGNYSVYVKGFTNVDSVTNRDLGLKVDNKIFFGEDLISQLGANVLNGEVPLVHLQISQVGLHDFQLLEQSIITVTLSDILSDNYLYNGNELTRGPSNQVTPENYSNLPLKVSFPNSSTISFDVQLTTDPTETIYSGVLLSSNDSQQPPVGLYFRAGPANTSGGVLLTQKNPLDLSNIYYHNMEIALKQVYHVQLSFSGKGLVVSINNTAVTFLSKGSPVTNNGFTRIVIPQNFSKLEFISLGLPVSISNLIVNYTPITVTNALVMQDPPAAEAVVTNYSFTEKSPSLLKISTQLPEDKFLILVNGLCSDDWVVTYHDPSYNFFASEAYPLNGNANDPIHWQLVSCGPQSVYVYYEPQNVANFGLLITITGTAATLVIVFIIFIKCSSHSSIRRVLYPETK